MFAKVAVGVPLYPHDSLLDYRIPAELEDTIKPGSLVEVPFRSKKVSGLVFEVHKNTELLPQKVKSISSLKIKEPVFQEDFLRFLRWVSSHYLYPIGEVGQSALPMSLREASTKVIEKGLLAIEKEEAGMAPSKIQEGSLELNSEQRSAVREISSLKQGTALVWGVTGSGKTEVYLKLIEEKIQNGEGAIVLVPEISLTPQLTQRFEDRFPGLVAVFHSDQKATQTRRSWLRAYLGRARIAIGPRSALFAPVQNLGAIIVDEEHDSSYKQEERLKYHAREAAEALCRMKKIPLILGSATPSLESYALSQKKGNLLLRLPHRAHGQARMPEIEIVDLKLSLSNENKNPIQAEFGANKEALLEPQFRGDFFFTPQLRIGIEESLGEKKQAILFLNRRGVGSQSFCPKCGHTPECPSCDVKLTPHRGHLSCHYCGFQTKDLRPCMSCGQKDFDLVAVGLGTEAVEHGIHMFFPKARVLRLDRDTTQESGKLHQILESFRNKEADILVGTQMVAKGHDFPDVTFVGVMLADLGWGVPDFRSTEKSLQLLLQVSGRAGRSIHPGKVVIQSFQPDAPVLKYLQNASAMDSYATFLNEEFGKRKAHSYSPFASLCLLRFEGQDLDKVRQASMIVKNGLSKLPKDVLQVLGPCSSPISKIALKYRHQILLKAASAQQLHTALSWLDTTWNEKKLEQVYKTRMLIDVDPVNML